MPLRGKQAGTRQLCRGRTSYRTAYTLHSAEHGDLSVPTAVVRTYQRRRSGGRQLRWLVYVCLGVGGRVIQVRKRYRRRFGIETGLPTDGTGASAHDIAQERRCVSC